jgi:hypothetical protein
VNLPSTSAGSCLCGAVRFDVQLPSKWVAHCHCTRCQRANAAALVTWAGFDDKQVTVEDPGHALRWYVAETGASRGFCGTCGSPLFFKSDRWPGEIHITRALFSAPLDREPQAHVFYETHVPWLAFDDDLPKKPSVPQ